MARGLAVVTTDVVDNGRGREATERGVRAALIVEVDEGRQRLEPLGVRSIRPGVGPLPDEGSDEPLGLAVGLRTIRPGPAVSTLAEDGAIGVRPIGEAVVGQDPLDRDPVGGEDRQSLGQGPGGAPTGLVGHLDDHASTAVVVDDHLEVVVPQPELAAPGLGRPAERAMPAAVGDPAELLVVLVDERAWVTDLVAADRQAGRPVDVGEPRQPAATQDGADGRGRHAEQRPEPVGTPAPLPPRGHDPGDLLGWGRVGRAMRSGAPVVQAGRSFEPIAADPLVAGRPADALGLGGGRHRPARAEHAVDQELAAVLVETRRTMRHESLLTVWSFDTPYRARRLSLVNNVPEDDS